MCAACINHEVNVFPCLFAFVCLFVCLFVCVFVCSRRQSGVEPNGTEPDVQVDADDGALRH